MSNFINKTKRPKRTRRATSGQIESLLAILEALPFLSTRKVGYHHKGRQHLDTGWKEVADELNQLPNGSVKTPEQWMTVWRDIKSRTVIKAAKLKEEKSQPRNVTTAPLNDVEKRIISIIANEYNNCDPETTDPVPEEKTLQEIESLPVARAVTPMMITMPQSECNDLYIEMEEDNQTEAESRAIIVSEANTGRKAKIAQLSPLSEQQVQETLQSPKRRISLNLHRSVVSEQNSAQRDFLAIAESNSESMRMMASATCMQAEAAKMLAEAAKVQAEAAKTQAEAAKLQAEAAKMQAEAAKAAEVQADALLLFAQAANKIGDALLNKNNT